MDAYANRFDNILADSDAVLSLTDTKKATAVVATGAIRKVVTVYKPTVTMSDEQKMVILTALSHAGRSSDEDMSKWKTWLFTMHVFAFPSAAERLSSAQYREIQVVTMPLQMQERLYAVIRSINGAEKSVVDLGPEFPDTADLVLDNEALSAVNVESIYSYIALTLFLSGKTVDAKNRMSITHRRPQALINTMGESTSPYFLTGQGMMSERAHTAINSAWATCVAPRIEFVKFYAQISARPDVDTAVRPIQMTMQMLRFAKMHYVPYIHNFISACPWALKMPQLAPDLRAWSQSIRQFSETDADFRPFLKLAYDSSFRIFQRRDISGLVVLGILWGSQTKPTLRQYVVDSGYQTLVAAFVTLARSHDIVVEQYADQASVADAV